MMAEGRMKVPNEMFCDIEKTPGITKLRGPLNRSTLHSVRREAP